MSHIENNSSLAHGSYKAYIIGFILSIILTVIPYYMVSHHTHTPQVLYISVMIFAVLQLLIQLIFFLHLGTENKPQWNTWAFIFTTLIVLILVIGSLWIMYNLNINMM